MKKKLSIALICVLLLSLCACGAAKTKAMPMTEDSYYYDMDVYSEQAVAYEMPANARGSIDGLALSNAAMTEGAADLDSGAKNTGERVDKLIYSANATVETIDFDKTLSMLEQMVEECGGWVESSSVSSGDYYSISRGSRTARSASYTLRIPGGKFGDVMEALKLLGNVPNSRIFTENVTAQYYDTQARLDAVKTQEASLLRLLEKAESVEDIITIEDKLTEVRYNIESLQSSLNNWDRQVSYSTINLNVKEVAEYSPEQSLAPSFGEKMNKAIKSGLENVRYFFTELVLLLTEALPSLIVMALVALLASLSIKKLIKKRKQRKAQQKENNENNK